jgi:hypothetical protein
VGDSHTLPNEVRRSRQRSNTRREKLWRINATPKPVIPNLASSVVVLFPEGSSATRERSSRSVPARPHTLRSLARMEEENAALRSRVVELALQIQDLKERADSRSRAFVGTRALWK